MENILQDFLKSLSSMQDGNGSDYVLSLGDERWNIHKTLAMAHSPVFKKAISCDFQEAHSGVYAMDDKEVELTDGIDCMVSFFYSADYNDTKYNNSRAHTNAKVYIVADKFGVESLMKLARSRFLHTLPHETVEEWKKTAEFVYHWTGSMDNHMWLREGVLAAIATRRAVLQIMTQSADVLDSLDRSTACFALVKDLWFATASHPAVNTQDKVMFECKYCYHAHIGSGLCTTLSDDEVTQKWTCPQCSRKQDVYARTRKDAVACASCEDGAHTTHEHADSHLSDAGSMDERS